MSEELLIYNIEAKVSGPKVLITAGVHGDEYEPMLTIMEVSGQLSSVLITGTVTLVPVANSSAYSLAQRCGIDDLDMARICPGEANKTPTESAAAQVSDLIRKADYYIDLHTGGRMFDIYPLTGYMLHRNPDVLKKQQEMARAFNLPVIWGTDEAPNGRTLSVARDANVPAVYVEYGGGGSARWHIVNAYRDGCLNVLRSLGMITEQEHRDDSVKYWVEDYTPNNGYLQGKMPAPAEGIFTPGVELGETVEKDLLWGRVIDPLHGTEKSVFADTAGIVLFLRAQAYVRKGDSLGGILPICEPGKVVINGN
jgi:predicted deacylase